MRKRYLILTLLTLLMLGLSACGDSPDHKLNRALISLRNGHAGESLRLAEEVLVERPGDRSATMIKARSHLRLRQYDLCQATFRLLIKQTPEDEEIYQELLDLALAHMSDLLAKSEFSTDPKLGEQFTKAKLLGHEQADWFAAHKRDTIDSDYARARLILLDAQRIDRYVNEEVDRLRTEHVADPTKPLSSASIEEQIREVKAMRLSAEYSLMRVVELSPDHPRAATMLTHLFTAREAWGEVWILGQKLAERTNLTAILARDLGNAVLYIPEATQRQADRMDLCSRLLRAVAPAERESPAWRLTYARFLNLEGKSEEANQIAQELMRIQPQDVDTRYVMASTLFNLGKYDLARTILSTLAVDARGNPYVQSLYGLTLMRAGDETAAIETLRQALKLNPGDFVARAALIQILQRERGSAATAIEHINSLYLNNPNDPSAIRFKFTAELANGNDAMIADLMRKVSQISPLKPGHLRVLTDGNVYLRKLDDAMMWAQKCLDADPGPVSYLGMARVHVIRGNVAAARTLIGEAKQKFPDSPAIDLSLATLYLDQGDVDRAIDLLNAILKKTPDDVDARLTLARSYTRLSMTEQALEEVGQILQRDPAEPRALEMASSIYQMMGQVDLSQSFLDKIDESTLDAERFPGVMAKLYLSRGRTTDALAICQRAIAVGNTDPLIRLTIAGIHASAKNVGEEEVHLLAFVREHPTNFLGYQLLASFYSRNNLERGLTAFAALRRNNETFSRLGEASLLNATGRREDAIRVMAEGYPLVLQTKNPIALSYARAMAGMIASQSRSSSLGLEALLPIYDGLIRSNLYTTDARIAILDLTWERTSSADRLAALDRITNELPENYLYRLNAILERYSRGNANDRALDAVKRIMARLGENYLTLMALGDSLRATNRQADAVGAYNKAIEVRPDGIGAHERLIGLHRQMGNYANAEQVCDAMAKIHPGARIRGLWSKADMFADLGLYLAASRVLDELGKVSQPDDPRVNYAVGVSLIELGNAQDGFRRLAIIPKYAGEYGAAQLQMARIEDQRNDLEGARTRLEKLLEDGRHSDDAARMIMEISIRQKDNASLLKWADTALRVSRLSPQSRVKWLSVRAYAQANTGDLENVSQTLGELLTLESSKSVRAARIVVLALTKKEEEAKRALQLDRDLLVTDHGALLSLALGLEISPQAKAKPLTRYLAGLIRLDVPGAITAIESSSAINNTIYITDLRAAAQATLENPMHAEVSRKLALAVVAIECEFPTLCDQIVAGVVKENPKLALAYGLALAAKIKLDQPVDGVQAAIRKELPDSCLNHFLDLHLSTQARKWENAIAAGLRIMEREPENDYVMYRLVTLYKLKSDTSGAIKLLEKLASRPGPFRDTAMNDLAYRLPGSDPTRLNEAYQMASDLRKKNPLDPNIADTLGWIMHLRKDHDEALAQLTFSVLRMKQSPEVQYHLGAVYHALGSMTWARRHLETAAAARGDAASANAAALLRTMAPGASKVP